MMAVRNGALFLASGAVGGFDMLFCCSYDRDADGGIFCKTKLESRLRMERSACTGHGREPGCMVGGLIDLRVRQFRPGANLTLL